MRQFTKEMKENGWTLVIPNMSEIHFNVMKRIFDNHGYNVHLLENYDHTLVDEGLKYVHNDMCYPCLLVIGQMLDAIKRGIVDKDHSALVISQTGGGCRASNYYFLLLKALERAGLENIPVISMNLQGMNKNPGLKITKLMLLQAFTGLLYGDLLMMLYNQTKPYEVNKGDSDKIVEKWTEYLGSCYARNRGYFFSNLKKNMHGISDDFHNVKCDRSKKKVKVGVVGEIYMKYSKLGNSNLKEFLESQDAEVMLPPMMGFVLYSFKNGVYDDEYYGGRGKYKTLMKFIFPFLLKMEKMMTDSISRYPEFHRSATFPELESYREGLIDKGCKMGEGWLLTAEMAELIEKGYSNIVCTQPFGCLPNHICGKGMIRPLKEKYPNSNIVPIDYDPSATRVNQENRIKLMLSIARENLEKEAD